MVTAKQLVDAKALMVKANTLRLQAHEHLNRAAELMDSAKALHAEVNLILNDQIDAQEKQS